MTDSPEPTPAPKRENPLMSLGFNIVLPVLIWSKGGDWFGLEPTVSFLVALAFPVGYGLLDFFQRRKANLFSIIGFVSILLTGGIGLLQLPKEWIVFKGTAVPLVLGIVTLGSQFTRFPIVEKILMNRELFEVDKIRARLDERGNREAFRQVLHRAGWLISGSFGVSAILNFVLASLIVTSDPGTDAFNKDLAQLQWVSYLVILAPVMAMTLWAFLQFAKGLQTLTGYELEEVMIGMAAEKRKT